MISIQNITKRYVTKHGDVNALLNVSLDVSAGQFLAVRGHSGSGKSTLLSLIGGLATPTSGSICVDGFEISSAAAGERAAFRASHIGFVFQMFHLLPYLNILDNVIAAAVKPGAEVSKKAKSLLGQFGLESRLLHRPGQLSAGERQRAAVARALINDPRLLLADEPTGNLDAKNAAAVLDLLSEFHENGGVVLLATHDETAAARAEGLLEIEAGEIIKEVGQRQAPSPG
jgi:ABC-type lipoprotein export system ATPase subunit